MSLTLTDAKQFVRYETRQAPSINRTDTVAYAERLIEVVKDKLSADELNMREDRAQKNLAMCGVPFASIADALTELTNVRSNYIRNVYMSLVIPYAAYIQIKGNCNAETIVKSIYDASHAATKSRCTVHLMQMLVVLGVDTCGEQADRYARALRFALFSETPPDDLPQFLKTNGGITGCAQAHSELTAGPEDHRRRAPRTPMAKVVMDKGVRKAIAKLDLPLDTDVPYTVVLRREANGRVIINKAAAAPRVEKFEVNPLIS